MGGRARAAEEAGKNKTPAEWMPLTHPDPPA